MTLAEQFLSAATESKSLTEKPSNETLLKLYSLFKQGSDGDAADEGPANPFDFVAKAKYNAWADLRGMSKDEAMQQYIDLVNNLKG